MMKIILFKVIGKIVNKKKIKLKKLEINRILILRLGAIGDVLRTTPLVRELRKILPDAEIDYITSEKVASILKGNSNINKIINPIGNNIYGNNISRLIMFYRMSRYIKRRRYDLILNLEPHWLSQFFVLSCSIPISIGWDRYGEGFSLNNKIAYDGSTNEVYKALELLKFFGKVPQNTKLDIFLSKKDKDFATNFIKKNKLNRKRIIGLAPGASKNEMAEEKYRRWSVKNYNELSKKLIDMGYFLLFFGNIGDKQIINRVTKGLKKRYYTDTSGKTSIKEAAALIKKCNIFISHDSGPMHIAAAMDIPIIALFGPTSPRRARPLTKSYVIYKKRKDEPEKYDIWGRYINCKKETYMERITVDDILFYINKIYKNF